MVFTTPDPNEGVIGGAYEQDIYIGDVVAYDKLAIQPAHKKYLAGWNAEEVVTVDGVSTTNTYTNLTLDEVANWEVKGKITFTAIWKDGFAIQYKEGREEIGVGIFGDFYGDHDHSHDIDGIEGKTLFAHVAPDSPTPAYNGMTFGQPRSIDNKLYSFAGWTYLDYATRPVAHDRPGRPLRHRGHRGPHLLCGVGDGRLLHRLRAQLPDAAGLPGR